MKKIFFTIVAVIILGFGVTAQSDGFFSDYQDNNNDSSLPQAPNSHGLDSNINAPIGSGLLILSFLGAGYALMRKKGESESGF